MKFLSVMYVEVVSISIHLTVGASRRFFKNILKIGYDLYDTALCKYYARPDKRWVEISKEEYDEMLKPTSPFYKRQTELLEQRAKVKLGIMGDKRWEPKIKA